MPRQRTIALACRDQREDKSASTQAGEFVREGIELIRKDSHGALSTKQTIAIDLSKARRAGVKLPPPKPGKASEKPRENARRNLDKARLGGEQPVSRQRSRATLDLLKRESRKPASRTLLAQQARAAARQRTPAERSGSAKKRHALEPHAAAEQPRSCF